MGSYWIRVDPKSSMTGVLIRKPRENPGTDTQGEGSHVKMEADTRGMCLQAKECEGPPPKPRKLDQKLGRGEDGLSKASMALLAP